MPLPLGERSAWEEEQARAFLDGTRFPLRLAVPDADGFPLVCSLWFELADGHLFCASHRDSYLVSLLQRNPRCGFEVSTNEPPYFGVRGRGRVDLRSEGAGELLGRLIDRYLGNRESELAVWLLSRADEELALVVTPAWMSSWDYRERMQA